MSGLLVFFILQALDIFTTLCFCAIGVQEANPILNALAPHTGMGIALFLVKCIGVVIGIVWYFQGKSLRKINWLFGGLIVWNLVAIFVWQHGVRYCERCWWS